jgi:serine/threonine protein kinase
VKLVEIIGRGASGVVYRGTDQVLGRAVAVKFLKPLEESDTRWKDRFLDEARAGAAVHHPNVVEIYQAGVAEGRPYLILQYVKGETPAHVLRRRGPLSISLVAAILEETAAAVDELHGHGIIHRDLKPSNILVDSDGHVHVSDLGVSLRRPDGKMADAGFAGTLAFMAPEVFEGRASPRSDVYALGVTLFELLTAEAPFGGDPQELRDRHAREPLPTRLLMDRQVPIGVIEVIERAMHKQPAFRYKSANDLHRAFTVSVGQPGDLAKARIELGVLLSRKSTMAGQGDPGQAPATIGSKSSTISELAESKRQRRPTDQPLPRRPLSPEDVPLPGTVEGHVSCIHCGYNLRGLWLEGKCAECGKAIHASLEPSRTIFAEPSWLRACVRGHTLVMISVLFYVLIFGPNRHVGGAGTKLGDLYSEFNDGWFGLVSLFCLAPLLWGIWPMTRRRTTGPVLWARRCRTMAAVPVVYALFVTTASIAGWRMGGQIDPWEPAWNPAEFRPVKTHAPGVTEGLIAAEVAAPVSVLICMGAIARSIPERQPQKRLRRAALVLISAAALFCGWREFTVKGWLIGSLSANHLADVNRLSEYLAFGTLFSGYALYLWTVSESRATLIRIFEERIAYRPPPMDRSRWLKIFIAALAFLVAAFCVFGFIASFEPGDNGIFKILYSAIGVACILSGVWLLRKKR